MAGRKDKRGYTTLITMILNEDHFLLRLARSKAIILMIILFEQRGYINCFYFPVMIQATTPSKRLPLESAFMRPASPSAPFGVAST